LEIVGGTMIVAQEIGEATIHPEKQLLRVPEPGAVESRASFAS
jgi:hypothetical protein